MSVIASNSAGKISFDVGNLKSLARAIKASRNMRVRVGLFPDKAARPGGKITMPELGAIHEFGVKHGYLTNRSLAFRWKNKTKAPGLSIPARSWLRMPIMLFLRPTVEEKGRAWWRSSLSTKGMHSTLKKLGICAENTIQNAFETGGFGNWKDLSQSTINKKGSSAILIDKGLLRKAVASKVVRV